MTRIIILSIFFIACSAYSILAYKKSKFKTFGFLTFASGFVISTLIREIVILII